MARFEDKDKFGQICPLLKNLSIFGSKTSKDVFKGL
jgi:hypothetical protein